jgi:hypothetical protein
VYNGKEERIMSFTANGKKYVRLCLHNTSLQITVPREYVREMGLKIGESIEWIPTEWDHVIVLKFQVHKEAD